MSALTASQATAQALQQELDTAVASLAREGREVLMIGVVFDGESGRLARQSSDGWNAYHVLQTAEALEREALRLRRLATGQIS